MGISENILWLVGGIGILQGFLLALLLYFHKKSEKSVNKFLALYIFFFSLVMSTPFIMKIFLWRYTWILQTMPFLFGPLLYFYIRSFKEVITWRKALPHLIIFAASIFPIYFNVTSLFERYGDSNDVPKEVLQSPATIVLNYLKLAHSVVYYFLTRRTLSSYQRSIKHLFSETSQIDLKWARLLVNGFIVLVCSAVVIFTLMIRFPGNFNQLYFLSTAIVTPYIYMAVYKGILQPTIWQSRADTSKQEVEVEIQQVEVIQEEKPEPGKSEPVDEKITEIMSRITTLMVNDKLFQESELTLQQLSKRLELPTYLVSQAINEGSRGNFYELINGYRVKEAKRLLTDPGNRNYTILSVGFDAGFNSKTTFNTVFKKFTGQTPTEYRDKQVAISGAPISAN